MQEDFAGMEEDVARVDEDPACIEEDFAGREKEPSRPKGRRAKHGQSGHFGRQAAAGIGRK